MLDIDSLNTIYGDIDVNHKQTRTCQPSRINPRQASTPAASRTCLAATPGTSATTTPA
ncbi:MAG: hypothetical protein IJ209_07300 [Bacteroidaceae bacterium]|nr:hypothetical protein [Bacteroidaceae bacterium]